MTCCTSTRRCIDYRPAFRRCSTSAPTSSAGWGSRPPNRSADIIDALADAGHIAADDAALYRQMVAFRNRVAHLDNRIDPAMLYEIVAST